MLCVNREYVHKVTLVQYCNINQITVLDYNSTFYYRSFNNYRPGSNLHTLW